jgi:hypothetical protein
VNELTRDLTSLEASKQIQMVRSMAAALMLLALMAPFDASWAGQSGSAVSGVRGAAAARREAVVDAGGEVEDDGEEEEDEEYDDEDYEEDEAAAVHAPVQPVNARAIYEVQELYAGG